MNSCWRWVVWQDVLFDPPVQGISMLKNPRGDFRQAESRELRPLFPRWGFMVHLLLFTFPLTLSLQSKISPKLDISLSQRSGGWQERVGRARQVSSLITRCTERLTNSDMWLKGLQRRRTTGFGAGSPGGALGMRTGWEPRKIMAPVNFNWSSKDYEWVFLKKAAETQQSELLLPMSGLIHFTCSK